MPRENETLGALVTTIAVLIIIIMPLTFLFSTLVNEAVAVYNQVNTSGAEMEQRIASLEATVSAYVPGLEFNLVESIKQATTWLASNVGAIFAGTASTLFSFFIAIIGAFYLFRDGPKFTRRLVQVSPLPDTEDRLILNRLSTAVRSVATGTVLIALIQGSLTAFGLYLFGFERFVLWGVIAAFGALIPSVGTSIVLIPAIVFLIVSGSYIQAVGLSIWGAAAVGLIDNLLGPYLIGRGNNLHPYVVLLSVLGGVSVFGPIGFVVGPVAVSLFLVLLELYATHIAENEALVPEEPV
ncbi:MAG TPA: AI-2E family transporter, partial [Candidatus Paceibacterota bacterium]|nr:AI-2E family transporter [Candidatus Paceibacterota bacterium]